MPFASPVAGTEALSVAETVGVAELLSVAETLSVAEALSVVETLSVAEALSVAEVFPVAETVAAIESVVSGDGNAVSKSSKGSVMTELGVLVAVGAADEVTAGTADGASVVCAVAGTSV